jgi:serine/threonine protein kinase
MAETINTIRLDSSSAPRIDKYPISTRIGKGGMGDVWLGHNPNLDIPVAIKTLPPSLVKQNPAFARRFIKEAKTAAQLNHSNIVRIYDAGSFENVHYIVMEYIDGGTIEDVLEDTDGIMDADKAVPIMCGVADALTAARASGHQAGEHHGRGGRYAQVGRPGASEAAV